MALKAVFIDKDGTLVENVPYNIEPSLLRFTPGALDGLRQLRHAGFALVLISNQSGVARGYFGEAEVARLDNHLRQSLAEAGVPLLESCYCFHHPRGAVPAYAIDCGCRKPMPGLILRAAAEHDIDLEASFMVGDILDDIEAGHAAGCRGVLLNNGGETEWLLTPCRTPDFVAYDVNEAAEQILDAVAERRALQGGLRAG